MAWIQALDVVGSFLGFTAFLAVLLLLGKVSPSNQTKQPTQRSF